MAVVISGPATGDPSYLQEQIDANAADIALLEARPYATATTVSSPTPLVQIVHGLSFEPSSVLCVETGGDIVEPGSISYPQPGVIEVGFGFDFTGQIRLS